MNLKSIVAVASTLVAGVACADGASNDTTVNIETQWADAGISAYAAGSLPTDKGWTAPDVGTATVKDHAIDLETEYTDALQYSIAAPISTQPIQTCKITAKFQPVFCVGDLPTIGNTSQAAISLVKVDDGYAWYGWGISGSVKGWHNLKAAQVTTEDDFIRNVAIAFKKVNNVNQVAYSLVTQGDTTELGTLTNAKDSVSRIGNVYFAGQAAISSLAMTQGAQMNVTTAKQTELASKGISDMNANGANGRPNWENAALGLRGDVEAAKPVVLPVQSTTAGKVTLALGGVKVDTDLADGVNYRVLAMDADKKVIGTSESVAAGTSVQMDLPASGVNYYRLEVAATLK